jgi:hypothetical protein
MPMLWDQKAYRRDQAAEVSKLPRDRPPIRWKAGLQKVLKQGASETDSFWPVSSMPAKSG